MGVNYSPPRIPVFWAVKDSGMFGRSSTSLFFGILGFQILWLRNAHIPQVESAAERTKRPGRRGQPTNLEGLMRRWLAARLSEKAAARMADQLAAANVKYDELGMHLPLLGSAALLQLARSNTDPQLVSIGANI